MWAILLLTLPTQPSAVRLRAWRSLKAMGCASPRDGTYLLPLTHADFFDRVVSDVRSHGGQASVMQLSPMNAAQAGELAAMFNRTEAYAQWANAAQELAGALGELTEMQARRQLRGVADALDAVAKIDFFPAEAAVQAQSHLVGLRQAVDAQFSKGEPVAQAAHGIALLEVKKFQGKRWATRARPWVDRLACAWFIRRFVDASAQLVWLAEGAGTPKGAIGFDFDGARFTHVSTPARTLVTFEVLVASFGLEADAALARIAQSVHYLDAGGVPQPEAAGLEAVLAGLREVHPSDDALAAAAASVFNGLYAAPLPKLNPPKPHSPKLKQ